MLLSSELCASFISMFDFVGGGNTTGAIPQPSVRQGSLTLL